MLNALVSMSRARHALAAALLGFGASAASAVTYEQIISGAALNPDPATWTSTSGTFTVVDVDTAYAHFARTNAPAQFVINRISDFGAANNVTPITTLASWTGNVGAPTSSRIFGGYGTELVGNYIQIPDTSSGQVYRVNKNTGEVSVYVSNDAIKTATGAATASITTYSGISNTGETIFYDGVSQQLLQTNAGSVEIVVSAADLAGKAPNSGLAYDADGNLYWGASSAGLFKRTPDGTITELLSQAQLLSVVGPGGTTWGGDVFYAPNGLIYLRYGSNGNNASIVSFDPLDPVASLSVVIGRDDLVNGPGGSAAVGPMQWYNGNLGWTLVGSPSGFYALPEPASLGLLALGSIAMLRRRK
jgi:hypothetical protein